MKTAKSTRQIIATNPSAQNSESLKTKKRCFQTMTPETSESTKTVPSSRQAQDLEFVLTLFP